jgi:hypothetical protein
MRTWINSMDFLKWSKVNIATRLNTLHFVAETFAE